MAMHNFHELTDRCSAFTLQSLMAAQEHIISLLDLRGETILVKNMQAIQLQRVIFVVGMFSIFEANIQDRFKCKNGFKMVREILGDKGEEDLRETFEYIYSAINTLKHGQGRSYEFLLENYEKLPFLIKKPGEEFFMEGDVSEVRSLVYVDDDFIRLCGGTIQKISNLLETKSP
ncbi:hypothetical protein ACM7VQ_26165 [Pseudomonas aeruginosa]|uniref:hypothetical protein n=1 Tax=Pseudomonas aeruginosa TaxID=287 RepID=UPI000F523B94|nr:hypothetical protein [Pseudomonas aeruginosa]RQF70653.1 hypothetical protein IPC260_13285 [Pseudomonas aeruginosa]